MASRKVRTIKRLIAIGDIHGHLDKLNCLLEDVKPAASDQLVFLGDYVNRGPDSYGVIERLIDLQDEFPKTIFLRGNHEQMLLDSLVELGVIEGERLRSISPKFAAAAHPLDLDIFMMNGGQSLLNSYRIESLQQGLPREHVGLIKSTVLWWRNDPFVFVHAGLEPGVPLEQQAPDHLLWARLSYLGVDETHVVGHLPTTDNKPCFEEGRYSLDTGAAYGGPLTACDVLTKDFWQSI